MSSKKEGLNFNNIQSKKDCASFSNLKTTGISSKLKTGTTNSLTGSTIMNNASDVTFSNIAPNSQLEKYNNTYNVPCQFGQETNYYPQYYGNTHNNIQIEPSIYPLGASNNYLKQTLFMSSEIIGM